MNPQATNPMSGPNRFKLGVFSANCDGGLSMSRAPERWRAEWPEIEQLAVLCDDAGIDFILPVAKWTGYQGEANNYGVSFETLTHGAALGALTKRIAIFCTVHVPLVTPAFAAKAVATIDHVTRGRVGLNIVCGWNQDEFNMHGVTIDADRRYDQGLEWFRIFAKLLETGGGFDWDGEFYHFRNLHCAPTSLQRPWPVIMSAGFSPKGRAFAGQAADVLFTTVTEMNQVRSLVDDVHNTAEHYGRHVDVYTMAHIVCRPTRAEAEDYYYYFAEQMADRAALDYYKQQKGLMNRNDERFIDRPLLTRFSRGTGKSYSGSYPGAYPLIGTPDDITDQMVQMHGQGLAGASVAFLNYLQEAPYFLEEVLPRMQRAGLRSP
jgi:FMNH2-dependent dimethyl sulfone monooxygenase